MVTLTEEQDKHYRSKYSRLLAEKSEAYQSGMLRAIAAAEALSDSVNEIGFDSETFAKVLASQHRTLQQNSMRAFVAFCGELAKFSEEGWYDGRNEASCKLASDIMQLPTYLPSV